MIGPDLSARVGTQHDGTASSRGSHDKAFLPAGCNCGLPAPRTSQDGLRSASFLGGSGGPPHDRRGNSRKGRASLRVASRRRPHACWTICRLGRAHSGKRRHRPKAGLERDCLASREPSAGQGPGFRPTGILHCRTCTCVFSCMIPACSDPVASARRSTQTEFGVNRSSGHGRPAWTEE